MKTKIFFILLFSILSANIISASDWELIDKDSNVKIYLDKETQIGMQFDFHDEFISNEARQKISEAFNSDLKVFDLTMRVLYDFDMSHMKLLNLTIYDGMGNVILTTNCDLDKAQWIDINSEIMINHRNIARKYLNK